MVKEFLGDEVCVCFAGARFSTVGAFPLALQLVWGDSVHMNNKCAADWRADLDASRDLSDLEKQNYGFLLSWFDSWRVRQRLEPSRVAAVEFWKRQVIVKQRKEWQLARWSEAVRW